MLFYYQYQEYSFKEQQKTFLQTKAVETTLRALFLPELLCSRGESESEDNCVDMLKARNLLQDGDNIQKQYYFDLFSYAKISIVPVYPAGNNVVIYDWPKPDTKNTENTFFVVALRDDRLGQEGVPAYGYGYLQVEVYS